jgi:hypothetical protein
MSVTTIPSAGLTLGAQVNFRNIIINGDMSIAQRSTSETSKGADAGYFTVDRMYYFENGTTDVRFTQSQSTDVPSGQGFASSIKFDCTTADASLATDNQLVLKHRLEGQNLQQIKFGTSSAESLTLSFWIKSTKTGTFIVELSREGSRKISKSYTVSSSDTWEKKTLTFSPDTGGSALSNDNSNRLEVNMYMGVGTNYSSGTLNTSWSAPSNTDRAVGQVNAFDSTSNNILFTGVQLEVGTSASDFEFLPFDVNLQRCLRYFEKTYAYGTAPATNTTVGNIRFSGSTDGGSNMVAQQEYSVEKRATPTQTYYQTGGTSGSWGIARSGSTSTATANNWEQTTKRQSAYFTFGASHNFATGHVYGHWTADAEL